MTDGLDVKLVSVGRFNETPNQHALITTCSLAGARCDGHVPAQLDQTDSRPTEAMLCRRQAAVASTLR